MADQQPERLYDDRTSTGAVHGWFGLSYSNYAVLPRTYLQSMPLDWQRKFVDLMQQLDAAYPDAPSGPALEYEVNTVSWTSVCDLTADQMATLGITPAGDDDPDAEPDRDYSRGGEALRAYDYVAVPVPNPVPPYNRGRTYLPPDEAAIHACRVEQGRRRAAATIDGLANLNKA